MVPFILHLSHLLLRVVSDLVLAKGTTKLGVAAGLAVPICFWLEEVWQRRSDFRRQHAERPLRRAFRECAASGKRKAKWTIRIAVALFSWFLVVAIYQDHESLAMRNRELVGHGNGNP